MTLKGHHALCENLLNRNSKSSSEGRRMKEPSDPESTLRLALKNKNVIMPRSLCNTDGVGSVLRDTPEDKTKSYTCTK